MTSVHAATAAMIVLLATGCPADRVLDARDTDVDSGGIDPTSQPMTSGAPTTTAADASSGASATSDATGTDPGTSSADATGTDGSSGGGSGEGGSPIPTSETPCGGTVYACGDLDDNDGDGFIDLFDPECTGPCDDDESSFATGIPGDNMDCKQDCFFDGNSGQGDDGCIWDLRCDPANPGADIGCAYTGGNNCNNQPPNQTPDCIMFCSQFVPPGCDCFGCCTVELDDGSSVDIFLNSGGDCAIDDLAACQTCTSQIDDCGNPCVPDDCELCFGQTELPPGCGMQTCDTGSPCTQNEDCPTDFFCLQGCCFPPPPG